MFGRVSRNEIIYKQNEVAYKQAIKEYEKIVETLNENVKTLDEALTIREEQVQKLIKICERHEENAQIDQKSLDIYKKYVEDQKTLIDSLQTKIFKYEAVFGELD